METERAGNSDTLMHIRGANNPAAKNPEDPRFSSKNKRRKNRKQKFIQSLRRKEKGGTEEMFNGKGVIDVDIPIFFVCVYVCMYVCGYVMYVCVCMYVGKLDMVRTAITQT